MSVHKFLFLLGEYLGVAFLDYMVSICPTILETAILFSKVAVRSCIFTSNVCVLVTLHHCRQLILSGFFVFLILAILIKVLVMSYCGFACISLIINSVGHLSMCSFDIHISSLVMVYLNWLSIFYWVVDLIIGL